MKWCWIVAWALYLTVSPSFAAQPTVFHVSPNGNDAWTGAAAQQENGTNAGPFATPARAVRAIRDMRHAGNGKLPGPVTITLHAGTYAFDKPLVITPAESGSAEAPITWAAPEGETAILSGGVPITGWREEMLNGRKVWVAKGPGHFFLSLWVNNERRTRARHPNTGTLVVPTAPNPAANWEIGQFQFQYKPGDVPTFTLAESEVITCARWVESRLPVIRNDEKNHELRFARRSVFKTDVGDVYWIENAPEFLDEPGEWYLKKSTAEVYYLPKPGEEMESFAPIAPRLEQLLRFEAPPGKTIEHVTFRNLTFAYAEWKLPTPKLEADGQPPRGGFVQAAHGVPAAVQLEGAKHCAFDACRFTQLSTYGLDLSRGCQDNRISRSTFTDLGAGGIKLGELAMQKSEADQVRGNEVSDCTINHFGRLYLSGVGLFIGQAYDNRIIHNLIHDGFYTGISVGWSWGYGEALTRGNLIEHNHVHHIGQLSSGEGPYLSDMSAIYTLGLQPGTTIRNNRFHDVAGRVYGGWGIYFDEGTSNVVAENNLVYNTTHGGFHQHYGRDNVVRNNIFAFGRTRQIERSRSEPHRSYTFEHNLVLWNQGEGIVGNWDNYNAGFKQNQYWPYGAATANFAYQTFDQWHSKGMDEGSVVADPGFVDPEKGDFAFKAGGGPNDSIGFNPWDLSDVGPRPSN